MYGKNNYQYTEDEKKVLDLTMLKDSTKSTFVIGDEVYAGNIAFLAKEYVQENPSKKFRTWLHDKGFFIGNLPTPKETILIIEHYACTSCGCNHADFHAQCPTCELSGFIEPVYSEI